MMKKIITAIFFAFCTITAFAQKERSIVVLDENKEPIIGAVVLCLEKVSGQVINYILTDTEGRFFFKEFNAETQKIRIEFLGYHPYELTDEMVQVILEPNVTVLNEVVVTAKPTVKMSSDRLIYSVAGSLIALDNNTWEVLKHAPLISSTNDNIAIIGKSGTRIYINGKSSKLNQESLKAYLTSLPASDIKSIEVITAPDVSFSGTGNFGIINILVKSPDTDGMQGSVTLRDDQAHANSQSANLYLHYRKGKFGTRASLYGNNSSPFFTQELQQIFAISQAMTTGNVNTWFTNRNVGGSMEMNYEISSHHDLSAIVSMDIFDNKSRSESLYDYGRMISTITDSTSNNSTIFTSTGHNLSASLQYTLKTGNNGNKLDLEADYINYSANISGDNNFNTSGSYQFIQKTPMEVNSYIGTAKYLLLISSQSNLTFGSELYYSKSNYTDHFLSTELHSYNRFFFDETLTSFYAVWGMAWSKKWNTRLGLRAEYSKFFGAHETEGEVLNQQAWNLYPSLSAAYNISGNHNLSVAFQHRLRRPPFNELNPYITYQSPTSMKVGNPYLKPAVYMHYQIMYAYKYKLYFTLSLLDGKDLISSYAIPYEENKSLTTVGNISNILNPRFTVSYYNQLLDNRLQINYTAFAQHFSRETKAEELVVKENYNSFNIYLDNTVVLWKKENLRLNAYFEYNSRTVSKTFTMNQTSQLNLSLMKSFSDLNIRVSAQDIFRTMQSRIRTDLFGLDSYIHSYSDNQKLIINVSYTFGNRKVKKVKDLQNSTDAVKQRIE